MLVNNAISSAAGRNRSLATARALSAYQTKYENDEQRYKAVYNSLASNGRLTEKSFLDQLLKNLNELAYIGSYEATSDVDEMVFRTALDKWKDFPEILQFADQNKKAIYTLRTSGVGGSFDAKDITNAQKFTSALFGKMRKADTGNDQRGEWISPAGFTKYWQNWRKLREIRVS